MATLQKICRKHQFNVILSYFRQLLDNYVLNVPLSKICIIFLKTTLLIYISWLCRSTCFSNVYDFPSQDSKLVYSFESISLNLYKVMEFLYLIMLAP